MQLKVSMVKLEQSPQNDVDVSNLLIIGIVSKKKKDYGSYSISFSKSPKNYYHVFALMILKAHLHSQTPQFHVIQMCLQLFLNFSVTHLANVVSGG